MGRWELPTPLATAKARMADGTVITLRRHGNPAGPRLVLNNGNGLAADLYYPFWSLLDDRFDIIVHDLRSHGWNAVSNLRTHNIPTFIRDNWDISAAIEAHFGAKPKIGVFHSMATLPALFRGPDDAGFAALVLFDPPICPPGGSPSDLEALLQPSVERARRRKRFFETREEFTEAISRSRFFALIPPETLELFAQTTLRPRPGGRVRTVLSTGARSPNIRVLLRLGDAGARLLGALGLPSNSDRIRSHPQPLLHAEHGPERSQHAALRLHPGHDALPPARRPGDMCRPHHRLLGGTGFGVVPDGRDIIGFARPSDPPLFSQRGLISCFCAIPAPPPKHH